MNTCAEQILHNITKQKLELVSNVSDSGVLANSILPILKDTQTIWQPADFLPDPSQESFIEEVLPLPVAPAANRSLCLLMLAAACTLLLHCATHAASKAHDATKPSELTGFCVQVTELRKRTADLPDDYFVVLIGDLITEEALPTYMAMLNTLDGVRDETGAAPTPWAR